MSDAAGKSRILTLVFTDLADSTALKAQRGDWAVGELIERHRELLGYIYLAMNSVELGRLDAARAAVAAARRVLPNVSLELIQRGFGVSRPEIDARRNAGLRQAGLE